MILGTRPPLLYILVSERSLMVYAGKPYFYKPPYDWEHVAYRSKLLHLRFISYFTWMIN